MWKKYADGFSIWFFLMLTGSIIGKIGFTGQGFGFIYSLILFYIILISYKWVKSNPNATSSGISNLIRNTIFEFFIALVAALGISIYFTIDYMLVFQIIYLCFLMKEPPIRIVE